jgi:dipeptidase E
MKGKLIITSGGFLDGQRGKELDKIFAKISNGKKVLFVDNATKTGSNVKGVSNIVENFKKIGAGVDIITLTNDNLNSIFNYDILYITGGDLSPLIELVNNSGFTSQSYKFLHGGGIIVGESAGSMIFSKDLKYIYEVKKGTKPKYDVELPTYKGIGFIDINIYPHWNKESEEQKKKVLNYETETNIKITRMQDGEYRIYDLKDINYNIKNKK